MKLRHRVTMKDGTVLREPEEPGDRPGEIRHCCIDFPNMSKFEVVNEAGTALYTTTKTPIEYRHLDNIHRNHAGYIKVESGAGADLELAYVSQQDGKVEIRKEYGTDIVHRPINRANTQAAHEAYKKTGKHQLPPPPADLTPQVPPTGLPSTAKQAPGSKRL